MKELETFYNTYYAQVFAFSLTLTRNRADAEDLASETFYRAISHADKFRGTCKMSVWLCAIAKNLFLDECRRRKRRQPSAPQPGLSAEERESAGEILAFAEALPDPFRTVFLMRTVGDAEYADIAQLFAKSESWARVTFHRARMKIAEKIRRQEDDV